MWIQRAIRLPARPRGFHLVTEEVLGAVPELERISVGILHLLIQHTSASLALSENASPEVRRDFEAWFDRAVRAPRPRRLTLAGRHRLGRAGRRCSMKLRAGPASCRMLRSRLPFTNL